MPRPQEYIHPDGVRVVRLESDFLQAEVAPGIGGRITSLIEKRSGHEFLWRNRNLRLQALPAGSEYDPNFYGGIDELLPNDIPENIDGVDCPDHGELWTTALSWQAEGERLVLEGKLPRSGLKYRREMWLSTQSSRLEFAYTITNETTALGAPAPSPARGNKHEHGRRGRPRSQYAPRRFLWKLHAALAVEPGDVIDCPARKARVVDLAWSRRKSLAPFDWPRIEGEAANIIPSADGTMDFFYLYELGAGRAAWRRPRQGLTFVYEFDTAMFPFTWLFASYGGFDSHYTVILEPCTTMPMSVSEAAAQSRCSVLEPGQSLETRVAIYAGREEGLATKPQRI